MILKTMSSIILIVTLMGCSAGISRYGYEAGKIGDPSAVAPCHIAIRNSLKYDTTKAKVVGKIKAYDTSFSTECDEAFVLETFYRDACMLGADIINITEETHPDWYSTCYRAKAEFITLTERDNPDIKTSDPQYSRDQIVERSLVTAKRNKSALMRAVTGGLLGGMIGGFVASH